MFIPVRILCLYRLGCYVCSKEDTLFRSDKTLCLY